MPLATTQPITHTDYLYLGDLLERELNIYFTADGRYYDPWLGKYLQPDAIGGPPLIPQAADRYQYAGNSPTGVGWAGTARNGGGIDLLSPSAWASVAADVGLEVAGRHILVRSSSLALRGTAPALEKALVGKGVSFNVSTITTKGGHWGNLTIGVAGHIPLVGGWLQRKLVDRWVIYEATTRGNLGLIDDLGGGVF